VARWWSHRPPLPVAVGLSLAQVADPGTPDAVTAALARHGLPPRALTIAVTEDCLTHEAAAAVLAELRARGVPVSVDDYGSGPSPVRALRRVPADELTLGPAVVADVATDVEAAAIARHLVALAHDLGLRVVADGVADGAVLAALAAMGCDAAQGPEIAAAMPVDDFVTWLRGRTADRPVPGTSVVQQRSARREMSDAVGHR
jgi:EAL domain-containing protein (putative c-di-GMP-specific phosphodiesterase class I)